jgi:hypothetical protein
MKYKHINKSKNLLNEVNRKKKRPELMEFSATRDRVDVVIQEVAVVVDPVPVLRHRNGS